MATYIKIVFNNGVVYSWKTKKTPSRVIISDLRKGQFYGLLQIWGPLKREVSLKVKAPDGLSPRERKWGDPLRDYRVGEHLGDGAIGDIMRGDACSYVAEPRFPFSPKDDESKFMFRLIIERRDSSGVHTIVNTLFDWNKFDGYDTDNGFITIESKLFRGCEEEASEYEACWKGTYWGVKKKDAV